MTVSTILEPLAVLVIVRLGLEWMLSKWDSRHSPTEPDEHAYVPARPKPRPHLKSGAVALEEPDEDYD